MKVLLVISLLFLSFSTQGQMAPYGTWPIGSGKYMDETEIANLHYLEFLYYAQRDSSTAVYQQLLPDTTVWQQLEPSLISYYRKPAYRYHPLVGVSYWQAQAYCRWRSRVVTLKFNQDDSVRNLYGLNPHDSLVVTYRLPSEQEWMDAAAGASPVANHPYGINPAYGPPPKSWKAKDFYPHRYDTTVSYKQFKQEFKELKKQAVVPQFVSATVVGSLFVFRYQTPMAIRTGPRNSAGLFNMVGNVAEMTAEPGVAKGGSFVHPADDCEITAEQYYTQPQAWLGFRCIAEITVVRRPGSN